MGTLAVLEFMHKTSEDATLRQQLENLLGVGDGNISSEAELDPAESEALKGERAPVVAQFAAENGFEFSVDELIAVVDAFQKHQTGQLSDQELAAIVGMPTTGATTAESVTASVTAATNPLKRLTRYMSKTYLGIDLGK